MPCEKRDVSAVAIGLNAASGLARILQEIFQEPPGISPALLEHPEPVL
jgi:hypothetical protein